MRALVRLAALLCSLSLAATVLATPGVMPLTAKELGTLKAERQGLCPDGRTFTMQFYDPDPNSVYAQVLVFATGNVLVAVRQIKNDNTDRIWIAAEDKWYPTDEVAAKYPSPCDLPTAGR